MTTSPQRHHDTALLFLLAGAVWDLVMTTVFFSVLDIPDALWFLMDSVGMAMLAIGFAFLTRRTLPVAVAYGLFAVLHLVVSTDPDGLGFLLGPGDVLIALAGVVSATWIARTEGWHALAGGVLLFTTSILVIGALLAIAGDAGLAWALPLYSVLMLGAWMILRRADRAPAQDTLAVHA